MRRFLITMSLGLCASLAEASGQAGWGRWEGVIEAARRPIVVFADFDKLEASLNGGPSP
jgi:hypothetical protein